MGAWREYLDQAQNSSNTNNILPLINNSKSIRERSRSITRRTFDLVKSKPIRSIIISSVTIILILTSLFSSSRPSTSSSFYDDQKESSGKDPKNSPSFLNIPTWRWSSNSLSFLSSKSDDSRTIGRWDVGVRDRLGIEPNYTFDEDSKLYYPPDLNPLRLNGYRRSNATFVTLVRNEEVLSIMASMRGVEDRINRKLGYPWVFLNDQPFTEDFKKRVSSMTRSKVYFGLIPREHWSYPDHINQTRAAETRSKMEKEGVIYGGSESYRHMCRYNSGFFFRHPILLNFDYYWRVEPGVEYYCDVDYDPFLFMEKNKKVYGFTISLYEYRSTIESLWSSTLEFLRKEGSKNLGLVPDRASMKFISDDFNGYDGLTGEVKDRIFESSYNLCHFWSNFEIGDLRFWRSKTYLDYFEHLDSKGGFFYERWGDAPVHSIAASIFLNSSSIHWFNDIAYRHQPYMHCPVVKGNGKEKGDKDEDLKYFKSGKCFCESDQSFDLDGYSCMKQWWRV